MGRLTMALPFTLLAGHLGQHIGIAVLASWSVNNREIVLLQLLQPPGQLTFGLL